MAIEEGNEEEGDSSGMYQSDSSNFVIPEQEEEDDEGSSQMKLISRGKSKKSQATVDERSSLAVISESVADGLG